MKPRPAKESDYIKVQGGKPSVEQVGGGTVNLRHANGMIVPTREKDLGKTTVLLVDGEAVEFQTMLLQSMHGVPCEARSRRYGGSGYERG